MDILKFSANWNNKLACICFTTIRLHNPKKHFVGNQFALMLRNIAYGVATVVEVKKFKLSQLNEFMAMLDTGYSAEETKEIIIKMYPQINAENQYFDFVLLKKNTASKPQLMN